MPGLARFIADHGLTAVLPGFLQFFQGPLQVGFGFLVEGGPELQGSLEAFGGLFVAPIHEIVHPDIVIGLGLVPRLQEGRQGLGILFLARQRLSQQFG